MGSKTVGEFVELLFSEFEAFRSIASLEILGGNYILLAVKRQIHGELIRGKYKNFSF